MICQQTQHTKTLVPMTHLHNLDVFINLYYQSSPIALSYVI
ncbi:hypothetical protein LINPERHAP1_LOCUS35931, partial [Linum perenne]